MITMETADNPTNKDLKELVKFLLSISNDLPIMYKGIEDRDKTYGEGIKTFLERQRKQDDRIAQLIEGMKKLEDAMVKLFERYEHLIS